MSKPRQEKRSKVKPFIKVINYNHLMPTRYTLELEGLKGVVSADTFKEVSQREDAKKTVKKVFEERYTSGKNRWFFTPLRMFKPLSTFASLRLRPPTYVDEEGNWLTWVTGPFFRILSVSSYHSAGELGWLVNSIRMAFKNRRFYGLNTKKKTLT